MKKKNLIRLLGLLAFVLMACLTAGCTASGEGEAASPAALAETLLRAKSPPQASGGEVIHVQLIFEELEGLPPDGRQPQPTRTTTDIWIETAAPWRYRFISTVEPGGLAGDTGWDGEVIWKYNPGDDPLYAVVRPPEADEIPTEAIDASRYANPYPDLLEKAQEAPDRLRDMGLEELLPWGTVQVIGYDWEGVGSPASGYYGDPHTIIFKVTEAEGWLVDWADVIHADKGDVVYRHRQLTVWETLTPSQAGDDVWVYSFPRWVEVVEALPEDEPTDPDLPTRTIAGWEMPDFGFTPWILNDLPKGWRLSDISVGDGVEMYFLYYEYNGQTVVGLSQAIGLGERWGNDPEIIELSWATLEIGPIEPMGPPGWIILVRPHQTGDEPLPNISLLVKLADKEEALEVVNWLVLTDE